MWSDDSTDIVQGNKTPINKFTVYSEEEGETPRPRKPRTKIGKFQDICERFIKAKFHCIILFLTLLFITFQAIILSLDRIFQTSLTDFVRHSMNEMIDHLKDGGKVYSEG